MSYAEKEKERLYSLVIIGIKFSYFLMLLIALPLMFKQILCLGGGWENTLKRLPYLLCYSLSSV